MILYHLTKKRNIESILRYGLVPNIGYNSATITDTENVVYLTDSESLAYWNILLDHDVVLKVTIPDDILLKEFAYTFYNELVSRDTIPVLNAEIVECPVNHWALNILRKSYIAGLSYETIQCVRAYNYDKVCCYSVEDFCRSVYAYEFIIPRLHYQDVDNTVLSRWLKEYGDDGEYTFLDTYMNGSTKLYEQLLVIKDSHTEIARRMLYNMVVENFSGCLDLNTGGWTG